MSEQTLAARVGHRGIAPIDVATGAALPLDGGLIQQLRPANIERPPEPPEANPAEGERWHAGRIDADHAGSLTWYDGASFGFVRPDAS